MVEHVLPGGRQRRQRAPVERVDERQHAVAPGAVGVGAVFARGLDGPLVGFSARIAKKHGIQPGAAAQRFGQRAAGHGVVQVGGMLQLPRLRRNGLHPGRVAVPQRVDADAGGKVEIAPALGIVGVQPLAAHQRQRAARVGVQHVRVVTRDDRLAVHTKRPLLPVAAAVEHRARPAVGEHLQQNGMRHPPVDDDGLVHALVDGVGHTLDFGQHTARDDARGLVPLDLRDFHLGDQRRFVVFVLQQPDDVGHADELFGLEGDGDLGRGGVGVDVVGHAVAVHADGGDDRDETVGQQMLDQRGIDALDLAHIAKIHVAFARAGQHVAVHAAQPDAAALEQRHQVLVDLPGQHLLHDAHGFFVGIAQPADEAGLLAHAGQHLVDGGAAAVHQHDAHTQQRQRDQVVHDGQLEVVVDHGVAAVFDDQRFAVVFLDVGRRLAEQQRHLFVFHGRLSPFI